LGRKTIILSHLGVKVVGADASAYAVQKARELAASERRDIEFFVSEWRALPERTSQRFDAVFLDAFLECCETHEDLAASFAGIAGVLRPGGAFVYFGPEPGEKVADVLDGAWKSCKPFYVDWHHAERGCECTCVHANYRGHDFIDDHHLHLVKEGSAEPRLENATVRRWFRWDRPGLDNAARAAGFTAIRTEIFEGYALDGSPLPRIIARK
jgi:SAM-dependent methyltransferase